MLLGQLFERFVDKTPFAVMARSLLERTLTPEALDALFEEKADTQYTRELTFSSVVDLMGQVVTSAFPSVRAAYLDQSFDISVSLTSLYGKLQGIVHYLFHRNTTMLGPTCYLQDLFTDAAQRGKGVGKVLIEEVYERAKRAGSTRVYWQTHETNLTARKLYDKVATRSGFIVYRKEIIPPSS